MCGIFGLINNSNTNMCLLLDKISHRGPDGSGVYNYENISIGHRRLAIIDPEAGKQPMSNEDNSIWITYNGELYNFLELKSKLQKKDHYFKTNSDTEVIIHAYEEWGDNCVNEFRGMFAFAILDKKNKRIFLARDHFGIKPLVYLLSDKIFAFASEIQALKTIPKVQWEINLEAIDQYLWLQYIPAPSSGYKHIYKLPPGYKMSVNFDGKVNEPEPYWNLKFTPDETKSQIQWLDELDSVLHESVKAHLVSDVPFGAFLSGGIDSSMIVAYMSQIFEKPVKTFSIGFEEPDYDERKYAKIVADKWGTDHHVEIVKPDALHLLPKLVQHYGEPFGDSSAIPTYYVSKLARQHVPMVLSGDGGDELFAGYNSYLAWMTLISEKPHHRLKHKLLYQLAHFISPEYYPNLQKGASLDNWLSIMSYMPKHIRMKLWKKDYKNIVQSKLNIFESLFDLAKDLDNPQKVQFLDLKTYLPFDILFKVDVASMANSLEVRTPLIDKKVIDFALTIPSNFNVHVNQHKIWNGKILLKSLAEKFYPKKFVHRKKMGFSIPVEKWFSNESDFHEILNERLLSKNLKILDLLESKFIDSMIKKNSSSRLWLLIFLSEWLEQNA